MTENFRHLNNYALAILPCLIVASTLTQDGLAQKSTLYQDSVTYRVQPNQPPSTRSGTIVDFNQKFLTLKLEKIERRIATGQIVGFQTAFTKEQLQADLAKQKIRFDEAIQLYKKALKIEPRPWVQRTICASLAGCYRELDLWIEATREFEKILTDEPDTRFYHELPLAWSPPEPNARRNQQAEIWIKANDESLALVAASLLLSTNKRTVALERLQALTRSKNPTIIQLATMQLWRSRMLTATSNEIQTWQKKLDNIAEPIRFGGYFIVGKAWAGKIAAADESADADTVKNAATNLLRIPIQYKHQHQLASTALHSAAKLLKNSDAAGAKILQQELARQYSTTLAGQDAARLLQNTKNKNERP